MTTPLRAARKARGETLQQVGSAVGIDTGNLSRIERGLSTPSLALTERLVEHFAGAISAVEILWPEQERRPRG
ncbi:helix-turn-helix domain-containing protein [Rivihabitans pingtungensis]|uniref:helix-turn-helix domain-containing protein n=1 Tax=Rivihabitans pingtungensis TaxID=1054498 RepID=UPI0023545181|nr:helix-turn-helix transcriptional regulator [Rivihabitans pingtungensis]MCK6435987.1 helix-turn-helix domain-containing protein [Rivihabitans pingtungensis]